MPDELDEKAFLDWYKQQAVKTGISPDPYDPLHYYDFKEAYKAGVSPGLTGHWDSRFKLPGHPRLFENPDGSFSATPTSPKSLDTRTGKPVDSVPLPAIGISQKQLRELGI